MREEVIRNLIKQFSNDTLAHGASAQEVATAAGVLMAYSCRADLKMNDKEYQDFCAMILREFTNFMRPPS